MSGNPSADAPRWTWSIFTRPQAIIPQTSLAEPPKTPTREAARAFALSASAGRKAKTYPPNPLLKNSKLTTTRTGIPAPAKLAIPETRPRGEFSRSSTHHKTPETGKSRKAIKDKFYDHVLSTQFGQAVSDKIAPHIPVSAVCGFPEDTYHSRNSYIAATFNLWNTMKFTSAGDLTTMIGPDEIPTWTRPDVIQPGILKNTAFKEHAPVMATADKTHPTVLRPGPQKARQVSQCTPPVPPNDEIVYRIPIHQPLKAETYNGKEISKSPTSLRLSYVGVTPDQEWRTSSKSEVKYYKKNPSFKDGLLLKAAPTFELTDLLKRFPNIDISSLEAEATTKNNRQQQVFGSYSSKEANEFQRGSDVRKSAMKQDQARTYPPYVPPRKPVPVAAHSYPPKTQKTEAPRIDSSPNAYPQPRQIIKRKPVANSAHPVTHRDKRLPGFTIPPLPCPVLPRRPTLESKSTSDRTRDEKFIPPEALPKTLPKVPPKIPPKPAIIMTTARPIARTVAKQGEPDGDILDKIIQDIDQATVEKKVQWPSPVRGPNGSKIPMATFALDPQAKTYVPKDKQADNFPTASSRTSSRERYRRLQEYGNHHSYVPGLNPTARTSPWK